MITLEDTQVLQVLRAFNKWWQLGAMPGEFIKKTKRLAFYEVKKLLNKKGFHRAILLSGARRVGKTTILHQFAEDMMKEGYNPTDILYISFDHPILKLVSMEKIISIYRTNIASGSNNILLLLDEVHYAPDWSTWIKLYVDFNKEYKIIATGSASSILKSDMAESGAGRWVEIKIPTLSFYEYIDLMGINKPNLPDDIVPTQLPAMKINEVQNILSKCLHLEQYFHKYLLIGGFPEIAVMDDILNGQRLLREDVIDKVLKRDMTAMYGVRNVLQLEQIFIYLCLNSGQIINKEKISSELGANNSTIDNHIINLEMANLIYRSPMVDIGGKKVLKQKYKIYMADSAIKNAVLLKGDEVLTNPDELGLIVETCVFKHVFSYYYPEHPQIGYWRETKTAKEVDVVVQLPADKYILLEVKYRENPRMLADDGIVKLSSERNTLASFIITKKSEHIGAVETGDSKLFRIPAFLFLYLLGHGEKGKLG